MTDHIALMIVFAVFVSIIFAVLLRDTPRDQLHFGARLLGGFIGAAIFLAWLMYPFPI